MDVVKGIFNMADFILPYCAYLRAFVIRIPNAYEGQIPYQNPYQNPNASPILGSLLLVTRARGGPTCRQTLTLTLDLGHPGGQTLTVKN